MFPIRNGVKQRDKLSPLQLNFSSNFAINKLHVKQDGFKLTVSHQLLGYACDINFLGKCVHSLKEYVNC
jgi:hypothetical protein